MLRQGEDIPSDSCSEDSDECKEDDEKSMKECNRREDISEELDLDEVQPPAQEVSRHPKPGGYILRPMDDVEPSYPLPRNLKAMAQETVHCCEQREYTSSSSSTVVKLPIDKAVESTWLHSATAALPRLPQKEASDRRRCIVSVVECGSMSAAEAVVKQGIRTCVLNFASGRNPGGGFLKGANAQEEALARVCGLYPCLLKTEVQAYYAENERDASCVYTDNIIVSPDVPVFRRDDGYFLDSPYVVGIITAPAPNMGVASSRASSGGPERIKAIRRQRMVRVLTLCAAEGFDAVVLGAWGCGVFRNDPVEVAREFQELLDEGFSHAFSHVVFAVIDEPTCTIFENVFAGKRVVLESHANISGGKGKGAGKTSKPGKSNNVDRRSKQGDRKSDRKSKRLAKYSDAPE